MDTLCELVVKLHRSLVRGYLTKDIRLSKARCSIVDSDLVLVSVDDEHLSECQIIMIS